MSASTLELIQTSSTDSDDEIWHLYCVTCYPDTPPVHGACGTKFKTDDEPISAEDEDPTDCAMCVFVLNLHDNEECIS